MTSCKFFKSISLLSCFFILFVSVEVSAATYYVAPFGSDTQGNGSGHKPWATPQYAIKQLIAGDTLNIKAGTYDSVYASYVSGSPGKWITIQNYNNDQVIIDRYPAENNVHSFRLDNCSYVVVDGLKITDSDPDIDKSVGMDPNDPDNKAFLNAINGNGGFKISACSHITIQNCKIYHTNHTSVSAATAGENENSNLQILNNTISPGITAYEAYGMYILGSGFIIKGNIISNCTGHGIRLGNHVLNFNNGLVEDNIVYDIGGNAWLHPSSQKVKVGGNGIIVDNGRGNIIQNNLVYLSAKHRKTYSGDYNTDGIAIEGPDNIVVNNTVYNMIEFGLRIHGTWTKNTIVRNNILFNNGKGNIGYTKDAKPADQILSHNLTVDPHFKNIDLGDFSLLEGSPAIDTGIATHAPSYDMAGNSRPLDGDDKEGAQYDVGACEFVNGGANVAEPKGFKILYTNF